MSCYAHDIPPQELIPFDVSFDDDQAILMRIYYVGAQVAAHVTIAAASGGSILFEHGATTGAAAKDTDTKLDADGDGIINIDEATEVTDYHSIEARINSSDNWRCVLVGALPDVEAHTTTVGHLLDVTDGDCTGSTGYAVKSDDSGAFYCNAGLTLQGHPTKLHNTDHQVVHRITRVAADTTYASGTSKILIYACDDDDGSKTLVKTLTAGATTVAVAYPAATTPAVEILAQAVGQRLVAQVINSAALTDATPVIKLAVSGYSYIFGPSLRKGKYWVDQL